MTIARPMFPPRRSPARAVPIYTLTPNQLEALVDLQRLRKEAEQEVERLIAFLDMVDGYSLSECEPSLGFPESDIAAVADGFGWAGVTRTNEGDQSDQRGFGCTDDREDGLPVPIDFIDRFGDRFEHECEDDDEEREGDGDVDDEPSLGSVAVAISASQEHWAQGDHTRGFLGSFRHDCELDEADLEPSLCGVTATAIPTINGVGDGEDDAGDDRELENEHGEGGHGALTVDDEPSLCGVGSHEFRPQPDAWRRDLDLEDACEDEGVTARKVDVAAARARFRSRLSNVVPFDQVPV